MQRYSLFTAPLFALFSRDFYRDVGRHWGGKAFLYILLLLAVVWLPLVFLATRAINTAIDEHLNEVTEQIPPIHIKDGKVTADVEQPYYIKADEPPQVIAIVDTTGEITSLDDTEARLLLTADSLIVREDKNRTKTHSLKQVKDFEISEAITRDWISAASSWLPWVMYPVVVLVEFILRIFQALFYALIGLIIASATGARLQFGGILSVVLVALTAPVLLGAVLLATQTSIPWINLISFAIGIGYVAFGVSANAGPSDDEVPRTEY